MRYVGPGRESENGLMVRTWTKARFNLFKYVFSLRIVASSDATLTVIPTTKFRIPEEQDDYGLREPEPLC